ncbi:helix-turn-helix transcriptional regulator [Luteipulveratus flavus]|uniref:AAA family ATPase n=1 Tax=Luteipulveratus flavus TaxID=3031728 RepID=A0ABT6C7W2_9MICO|nr:helix-turn-helix transcriptional regulator [Luteipulveratus sp. YIM 133296]MDF8264159.1 AAA family ATPase [Luteipulveratus sp. YIM 133296]
MLVGREVEQRAVERLLAGARLGQSRVLVVSGDPGIGKTTLLRRAEQQAEGLRLITVRGVEAEREVAFGGLHQLCTPLLDLLEELPGPQTDALAVALALRRGGVPQRFAVGAALLGLLTRAADDAPVLALVDDAHLLDTPSAQAIAFAARRLVSDPVGVLVAMRPDPASPLVDLPYLTLGPLTLEETGTLLEGLRAPGTSGVAVGRTGAGLTRFHEATGGNPLAVVELADEADRLAAAPPGTVLPLTGTLLAAYSRRVRALDADVQGVLLLAATDSHDVAVLRRACAAQGLDAASLADAERAGLVELDRGRLEFRHPLVRAAVLGAADPPARRAAHTALAAAIEAGPEARGEGRLGRRAWHLAEAAVGPDPDAAGLLVDAARDSGRRGAYGVAAAQWQRAAALTEETDSRSQWLLHAGEQAWLAGGTTDATALVRGALDLARTPPVKAVAMARLGAIEGRCGSLATARDLQLGAARLVESSDPGAATLMLAEAVETCLYLCDTTSGLAAAERLLALRAAGVDPGSQRVADLAAGVALVLGGQAGRGSELVRRGMSHDAACADTDQWQFRWSLVGPLFLREGSTAVRAAMTAAVQRVRESASVGMLPFLLLLIARDQAGSDRWADAEATYTEAVRLARESGHLTDLALALGGLAWLEARRGHDEAARRHAEEGGRLAQVHDAHLASVWAAWALADRAMAAGQIAEATAAYTAVGDLLDGLGVTDPDLSPAPELVECHRLQGDGERAPALADTFLGSAEAKGQPWALARAHRAKALTVDGEQAEEQFAAALACHDRSPDDYESARTRLVLGAWLRRSRRRVDARRPLRAALSTFERLGAAPWADRAAAELEATGDTAVRHGEGATAALTPQERQIAGLLAAGSTTRQAAVALFLSPKTVEYHLRHVYLKLGISSREELRAAMRD